MGYQSLNKQSLRIIISKKIFLDIQFKIRYFNREFKFINKYPKKMVIQ
jgi:hypothetical protein